MGDQVSSLITQARAILNDGYGDNFTRDDISDLADGVTTVFQAYNQNISNAAAGSPADPVIRVNGTPAALASYVAASGMMTASAAPAAQALTYLEYWFTLMTDPQYLGFAQEAAKFIGLTPAFTLVSQDSGLAGPAAEAAVHWMAHLGATKMASLSSWYYRAGAGNKNIDKAVIAQAFAKLADDQQKLATAVRNDIYTREGQRNAPGWGTISATPPTFPSYTPRR